MHFPKSALFFFITLIYGSAVSAQNMERIDEIFKWSTPDAPGCVCAVSKDGKLVVSKAYGSADLERNVLLDTESVFDAGSLTKQFVAAAALMLVEEGRISLSDDIRKYIPELHDYGHSVTIDHLLTHTSGIRDWTAIKMLSGKDEDAITMAIRQRGLNFVPGTAWSYSNSGYALMKEVIARVAGISFGEFAQQRIFEPLGMKHTRYQHDLREVINNRALAYNREGKEWKLAMLFDNDRGGGGALLSTAEDLVIWNNALTNGSLGQFVSAKIQEPAKLSNGRKIGYARGLFIEETSDGKMVWHGGSANGYKSLLGRFMDHDLSIAILCNGGDEADRMEYATSILRLFVPAASTKESENDDGQAKTKLSEEQLRSFAGLYINEANGEPLRLMVNKDRIRIVAGPELVAVSDNRLKNIEGILNFRSDAMLELEFLPSGDFELTTEDGSKETYRKSEPPRYSIEELREFEGRYESEEIGTAFHVSASERGLEVALEHSPERKLIIPAISNDIFQLSMMAFKFLRNENGEVIAIDLTSPLLRHVVFGKV